jgi:MFS family permease
MYFFGLAASAIVLPRISDIFGRKKIYFIAMALHLIVYFVFLVSTSLTLNIVMMLLFGALSVGRASIGYIYMQEFTPIA